MRTISIISRTIRCDMPLTYTLVDSYGTIRRVSSAGEGALFGAKMDSQIPPETIPPPGGLIRKSTVID